MLKISNWGETHAFHDKNIASEFHGDGNVTDVAEAPPRWLWNAGSAGCSAGLRGLRLAPSRSTKLGSAQGHKPSPSLRFMMFYYWVYPYSMVNPIITYPSLISDVKWRPTGWLIGWFMALGLPQILRVFVLQVSSPEICSVTIVNQDEPSYSSAPMTLPVQKMAIKKAYISEDEIWPLLQTTVDGRNPAPAWMVKTLQIMG